MIGRWIGLVVFVVVVSGCARVIDDGETGVKFDFGRISTQPLATGLHWFMPVVTRIERWNVKTREIKETANVPSSEGLISTLDVSVLYNVPRENVITVRRTIGYDWERTVLEPYTREAIRNVASGYEVKALFSDKGRYEIGQRILQFLQEKLTPRGILIQDVLLRDVRLPATFARSIEEKLKAEQEALQKEFELKKAKKDAEIEVARAEGVAKSNVIIGQSISENYLRWLWVRGLQETQNQVIYVPTEANAPIMEAGRLKQRQP